VSVENIRDKPCGTELFLVPNYIMSMLKDLQKSIKAHHVIILVGLAVLFVAIHSYSGKKGSVADGMANRQAGLQITPEGTMNPALVKEAADAAAAMPANPAGMNEQYASAAGVGTSAKGLPPSCAPANVPNPADLLPKDENSQWARLNPAGNADMKNVNMLKAGWHNGINTVGSSLRNANQQVRSEPPNPTSKVSIWNNSTIEPDLMRVPLEIGCGPQ
jgi:hypothetical protein